MVVYIIFFTCRSQGLCAVRAFLLAPERLHRKEDLSAAMTVFHVQMEKSVMRQVILNLVCVYPLTLHFPPCIALSKGLKVFNLFFFLSNYNGYNFLSRFK